MFDGKYFKRLDGLAIVSPPGPSLVNFLLGCWETHNVQKSLQFPKFFCRYVDDIFSVFDNDADVKKNSSTFSMIFIQISNLLKMKP